MATLTANSNFAFDLLEIDLNYYARNYYDSELIKNANQTINGVTYQDVFWINGWDGVNDYELDFGGFGLTVDASGAITGGTVTGILERYYESDIIFWVLQGISTSALGLYRAGLTLSNSDELTIVAGVLAGNDTVYLSNLADRMLGYAGNDVLNGFGGNDTLDGGLGNDTLDGGAGNDSMTGGAGNDTYIVDTSADIASEAGGADIDLVRASVSHTLGGSLENLTLTGAGVINGTGNALANAVEGNQAANVLAGMDGNDSLAGGGGDDTLDGGAGVDTLIGGAGNDTYLVDSTTDVITEAAEAGIDTLRSSVTFDLAAVANAENLTLAGTAAIAASGNSLNNTLTGNSANNTLGGGAGSDTLIGGSGDDTYLVDSTTDTISEAAAAGIDAVQSSVTFSLAAIANLENLTLTGAAALNGTGNDLANTLTGNSGGNSLAGGDADDTLIGGAGNDTLTGGAGLDSLQGGSGADSYFVASGDVVVEAPAAGSDTVLSAITWTLGANFENLTLTEAGNFRGTGNVAANTLTGNAGDNLLSGLGGADRLFGGTGNDTLRGGAGKDTLSGGDGADKFLFDTALSAASNVDTVTDFTHLTDRLRLDDDVFTQFTAGVGVRAVQFYAAAGAVAAHDVTDRIIYDTSTGALYYDADGTGAIAAVQFAVLATQPTLTVSDFVIVG